MKHNVVRNVLAILLAAVAVFEIIEGVPVLTGVRTPGGTYQGTLFGDATGAMLLLVVVVGGTSLLAAVAVYIRHAASVFLAAAAGLILIAWAVAQAVVARQSSAIFVAIGLAVIALAEYLWITESRPQQLPAMKHDVIRIAVLVMEAFIAVGAIDGGLALLRGAFDQFVSIAWLAGTPFSDYTIPGLVLVIVVGGTALLAAATVFIHREWAVLVSVIAGLMMVGYILVEAVSLDSKVGDVLPTVLAMQLLYFLPGLAIVGMAGFLWMREYRSQQSHPIPVWGAGAPANRATATR